MGRDLAVLLSGERIGTLTQTDGGQHEFHYEPGYAGTPLSLSMPTMKQDHYHRLVEPYLLGLLPDNDDVKESIGAEFGVSGRNPFAMLSRIGLDIAGAAQFCDPASVDETLRRPGSVNGITEAQIEARLAELRVDPAGSWIAPTERWSLGGAQAKFALRETATGWAEATGSEPSTHIFKPGVQGFSFQALNEHVCLDTARRLGLDAVRTRFMRFGDEGAIVVARYDRRRDSQGQVTRVHQEDMCQALGVFPHKKYESARGPRAATIVELLGAVSPRQRVDSNLRSFVRALAFNYLIGAPDAHAKNYSVLLAGNDVRLAPLYDVASGFPYETNDKTSGLRQAAMAIGGERTFGYVKQEHWVLFAKETRLDADMVLDEVRDLSARLPDALNDALKSDDVVGPTNPLRERKLLDHVAWNCRSTTDSFSSTTVTSRQTERDHRTRPEQAEPDNRNRTVSAYTRRLPR